MNRFKSPELCTMMISGLHAMIYTSEPEALRAFFRDKLGFPSTDAGDGWLIFQMPAAELGCHPHDTEESSFPSGTPYLSFTCDDIVATVTAMKARGVEFVGEITDYGYGTGIHFKVPGDFTIQVYQPAYEMKK